MHVGLSDGTVAIQTTARELLEARQALAGGQAAADGLGYDLALWAELGELGWVASAIPEEHGGGGLGVLDVCVLLEEVGYGLAAVPLLSNVMACLALHAAGSVEQRNRWLPELASGSARGAVGVSELIPDGLGADVLVLLDGGEPQVVAVADAHLEARPTIDPTRPAARMLGGERQSLPGDPGLVRDLVATAAAAELVGVAQRAVDLSVAYAGERHQFGRPIGSFQALSHRLARAARDTAGARLGVHLAGWAAEAKPAALAFGAAIAKAESSEAALFATRSAIQVHGGMGFTWEHPSQLLYKRAEVGARINGTAADCYDRITSQAMSR